MQRKPIAMRLSPGFSLLVVIMIVSLMLVVGVMLTLASLGHGH